MLVENRFQGVNNSDLFLFCVSNLFDRTGVNYSEITLKEFRKHTEAKVTFNKYLFDLVFFSDKGKLFKVYFAVTASQTTGSEEEQVTVEISDDGITEFIATPTRGVYGKHNSGVFKKLRTDLGRLLKQVSVKTDRL
jgi:hypothetical protein